MFFALSKVADILASPLTWALALVAFALLKLRSRWPRRRALGLASLALALLVLYVFSLGSVANRLLRSLESSANDTTTEGAHYDAVIVLGGLLGAEASESSHKNEYNGAIDRLLAAFDMLRSGRARFVLISGGATNADVHGAIEARVLAEQLESWGIAGDRIVVEAESRNTHENAAFCAPIVQSHHWTKLVLVTSAFHMQRAAGCFRVAGLTFDTLPVDYNSYDPSRFSSSFLPRAEHLGVSTAALHEYLGRIVDRARGYSL